MIPLLLVLGMLLVFLGSHLLGKKDSDSAVGGYLAVFAGVYIVVKILFAGGF